MARRIRSAISRAVTISFRRETIRNSSPPRPPDDIAIAGLDQQRSADDAQNLVTE